jgi:hypothetical protein
MNDVIAFAAVTILLVFAAAWNVNRLDCEEAHQKHYVLERCK